MHQLFQFTVLSGEQSFTKHIHYRVRLSSLAGISIHKGLAVTRRQTLASVESFATYKTPPPFFYLESYLCCHHEDYKVSRFHSCFVSQILQLRGCIRMTCLRGKRMLGDEFLLRGLYYSVGNLSLCVWLHYFCHRLLFDALNTNSSTDQRYDKGCKKARTHGLISARKTYKAVTLKCMLTNNRFPLKSFISLWGIAPWDLFFMQAGDTWALLWEI